jgi:hypothetical protein
VHVLSLRLGLSLPDAQTLLERWTRALGDCCTIAAIAAISASSDSVAVSAAFLHAVLKE